MTSSFPRVQELTNLFCKDQEGILVFSCYIISVATTQCYCYGDKADTQKTEKLGQIWPAVDQIWPETTVNQHTVKTKGSSKWTEMSIRLARGQILDNVA